MKIISVSLENFFSFKDKVKMCFLVNQNAPQNNHFGDCNNGKSRFSKVSSIFGANASGKTNLIAGVHFLRLFISESFSRSENGFSHFAPFATMKYKPSSFEVEFYIEDILYKLSLKLNTKRVLSETLEKRKDTRWTKLYSREYIEKSDSYSFEAKNINLESNFIEKVRPNASIISTARQFNHPELTKISEAWLSIYSRSECFDRIEDGFLVYNASSKFYAENEDYFLQAKDFLKKADLGFSDIYLTSPEIEDNKGNKIVFYSAVGIHKSKCVNIELPFMYESEGTIHLYNILAGIFPALKKGSVCIIDELEYSLHPNILPAITGLFISPETNPKGAQLIYTTHMSTLMADLSKYQIFLVEKNSDCESEVYRLDDVEGVRGDDNLFKKYLSGTYGGIPDIDT